MKPLHATNLFLLAGVSSCLAFTACTSGEKGMVLSRRTLTAKALVVDSYTLGLSASLHPATGGATFGYRHTTYLYPREAGDDAPSVGPWTWFHTPLPDRPLVALASVKTGVVLAANRADVGFNFGHESSFVRSLPATESALVRLRYRAHAPAETIVEFQQLKNP